MKVRVFLMNWSYTTDGQYFYVIDPVTEYLKNRKRPEIQRIQVLHSPRDITVMNAPNNTKPYLMVIIFADNTYNFNELSTLTGVTMLPTNRPIDPTSNIPQIALDSLSSSMSGLGLQFNPKSSWGNTIKDIASQIDPNVNIDPLLKITDFS